ncbi:MAG: energy-coupling factor transporter transmembrane component T [Candidatus Bathyarchaeia archaeon]|nr:energy-coupling factor transporter transmembrane protein EcfT [Candidatus Bathyarchaeota archaeon]
MTIEYVAGKTIVHKMHPLTKLAFASFILATSFFLRDIASLSILIGIVLFFWFLSKIPDILRRFKLIFVTVTATVVLWIVAQGFFAAYGKTPLFTLFELHTPLWPKPLGTFYLEGLIFGLAMGMKAIAIVASAPILTLTTPIPHLIVALSKLKIPYKFNFTLATAVRFSPLIVSTFYDIQDSQVIRAHDIDKMGYFEKIKKAWIPVVTPLFMSLLRRSDELEIAIESRAFGAPVRRTYVEEIKFKSIDYVMFAFMISFFIFTLIGMLNWGGIIPSSWLPPWAQPPEIRA